MNIPLDIFMVKITPQKHQNAQKYKQELRSLLIFGSFTAQKIQANIVRYNFYTDANDERSQNTAWPA